MSTRILKRIPRGSRISVASKLASILAAVVEKNDDASWDRLFRFCSRCLRNPGRGGHRRSLATEVNKLLREEADPLPSHSSSRSHTKRARDPLKSLAIRVTTKLEEGDFKGAIRLACSEESIADQNEETLAALRSKHPQAHPSTHIPTLSEGLPSPPWVSEDDVIRAICSFPSGSAGGPDGLRPQHLKDLTGSSAEKGGRDLRQALTSFVNLVLQGRTPSSVRPFFFGATLVALRKKEGGIRPIAVGNTLRRLVAKCAGHCVTGTMQTHLAPKQLGYGTPLGGEAAAHAARIYLHNMAPDHLMLKLDFRNAFNCLRRDRMLEAVRNWAPELFPFIHSAYEKPSSLYFGDHIIQSAEGVQQGDPLGPLLFCLTIHPMVSKLRSEFRVLYLDDGTLAGNLSDVLQDFHQVEMEAANMGLQLNCSKSELICEDPATREAILSEVSDLHVVSIDQVRLLGSHIGSTQTVGDSFQEKIDLLQVMGHRLHLLQAQDALLLLRHSLAIPKVLFNLRTSPCFLSTKLEAFDLLLRHLLDTIINIHLDDTSWLQASLPVKAGGIGIRSAVQLAPSAYLASAAGCTSLVHQILPPYLQDTPDPNVEAASAIWSLDHNLSPPLPPASSRQRAWDGPRIEAAFNTLLESSPDENTRARLLAVATKESGAWLNAFPMSSLGLRMANDVIRIAVGLRLGLPLCRPHHCHHCGAEVTHSATHGLSCRFSKGRHPRHAAINDIIKRSLGSAKIPCHLEPTGIYRSDGKRPDGATMVPWERGRILIGMVWDATCPDTMVLLYALLASEKAGVVAAVAKQRKRLKYAHWDASHHFTSHVIFCCTMTN